MDSDVALVHQLWRWCGPDAGQELVDSLADSLGALVRDVAETVPSCLAVSLTLTRHGEPTTVTARPSRLEGAAAERPVRASLAVPLAAEGSLLVLRAAAAGAFLVLADDLAAALVAGRPRILLDEHLDEHLDGPPGSAEQTPTSTVDDVRAIDRAIGVLLERGLPPREALAELRRRARESGLGLGAVSRALVQARLSRATARPVDDDEPGDHTGRG